MLELRVIRLRTTSGHFALWRPRNQDTWERDYNNDGTANLASLYIQLLSLPSREVWIIWVIMTGCHGFGFGKVELNLMKVTVRNCVRCVCECCSWLAAALRTWGRRWRIAALPLRTRRCDEDYDADADDNDDRLFSSVAETISNAGCCDRCYRSVVCPSVSLSHSCTLLKPLDGMGRHLAGTLVWLKVTLC